MFLLKINKNRKLLGERDAFANFISDVSRSFSLKIHANRQLLRERDTFANFIFRCIMQLDHELIEFVT